MARYPTSGIGTTPFLTHPLDHYPVCVDGGLTHLLRRQVRISRENWSLREDRLRCVREHCDFALYDWAGSFRPRDGRVY